MDELNLVVLLVASGYIFGLAAAIFRRCYHPNTVPFLIAYLLLSLLGVVVQLLAYNGRLAFLSDALVAHLPLYGILALSVVLFWLTWNFGRNVGRGWLWSGAGIAAFLGAVVLVSNPLGFPDILLFQNGWAFDRFGLAKVILISGWASQMAGATFVTSQALRRTVRYSTSYTYWILVLFLTVAGDGLYFANIAVAGSLLMLAGALLAVYTLTTQRLPEISHNLRRSISFLAYAVPATLLYLVCLGLAQEIFWLYPDLPLVWFALGVSILLVILVNPVLRRYQGWIKNLISGAAHDPTTMLRQYSQTITNTLDLQLLGTVTVGLASEYLDVSRGYLFLVEIEKDAEGKDVYQLRGVRGMGNTGPLSGRLSKDSQLAAAFREQCQPVSQSEIDLLPAYRDLLPDERSWLASLVGEVYAPICAKKEWIGLLVLGAKRSGAEFSDRDLAFLGTMADQTAVALENTRLVDGLMRLNNDFRRAYTALDQANRHLERLDRTKSDFISIASHELRTPLTLISGSSQMLMEDPGLAENAYYQQLISKIHSGTLRLHEIVDAMLDVAKIDARDLKLDTRPVVLAEVIEAVRSELKKSARDRNQEIDLIELHNLPSIVADAAALRKVFYHLIINAIKYTPDGGKITISGQVLEPNLTDLPKGGVEIIVSDTGIGIDPRFHELIFVKFYKTGELALHSSGKTKFKGGGPGLGLAIAHGIVVAHQGRIWVESLGHDEKACPGSQFHVVLPLCQQEANDSRPAQALVRK